MLWGVVVAKSVPVGQHAAGMFGRSASSSPSIQGPTVSRCRSFKTPECSSFAMDCDGQPVGMEMAGSASPQAWPSGW